MFTGIITDLGCVLSVTPLASGVRMRIATSYDVTTIELGASIACNGACMTVIRCAADNDGKNWFEVEVSSESLDKTTLGDWRAGTQVNLERSLCLGDEMGGHMVTGHVDGRAKITARNPDGDMTCFSIQAPRHLAPFIASKGSIALNGTSLTVNEVKDIQFSIMLIPHTLAVTSWGERAVGDAVNLEIDLMARYVGRLMDFDEN